MKARNIAPLTALTAMAGMVLIVFMLTPADIPIATIHQGSLVVPILSDTPSRPPAARDDSPPTLIDFKLLDEARQPNPQAMQITYSPTLDALEGKRVSIIGFMAPFESLDDMSTCMVLPSYVGCFFCKPPSFTQVILVNQRADEGKKKPFIESPSLITGTLLMRRPASTHPAHEMEFVYVMEDAVVVTYDGANAPTRVPGHWQKENPVAGNALPPAKIDDIKPEDLVLAVATVRDLVVKKPIKFTSYAAGELESAVEVRTNARRPPGGWSVREKAYAALGFIQPGDDLRRMLMGLTLQRTIGYSNAAGDHIRYNADIQLTQPVARLEMVKLIAEALIRQNIDLTVLEDTHNDDARFAAQALLNGDLLHTAQRYSAHARLFRDPAPGAAFSFHGGYPTASTSLQQLELLPWQMGPFFLDQLASEPAAINALYARPPRTTAEIIHLVSYVRPEDWQPQPVSADSADKLLAEPPAATGVLGEAGLLVWIAQGKDIGDYMTEAEGWRGDRFAYWNDGTLLITTRWADEDEASEFSELIRPRPQHHLIISADRSTVHIITGPEKTCQQLQARLKP